MMRQRLRRVWRWLKRQVRSEPYERVRTHLARTYLIGQGLEIGALHNPLPVPPRARVRYVDRLANNDLRRQYPDLATLPLVPINVLDDGERLTTIPDESQDFVIANHFLEHCEDPIATVTNFFRVMRPGGVLYMAVPDMRYTFDKNRPITPLEHLIDDHRNGPELSRRGHFIEFARLVHGCDTEDGVQDLADHYIRHNYSIHFHVWTQREMLELLLWLRNRIGFDVEAAVKNGFEFIFILRKHAMAIPRAAAA